MQSAHTHNGCQPWPVFETEVLTVVSPILLPLSFSEVYNPSHGWLRLWAAQFNPIAEKKQLQYVLKLEFMLNRSWCSVLTHNLYKTNDLIRQFQLWQRRDHSTRNTGTAVTVWTWERFRLGNTVEIVVLCNCDCMLPIWWCIGKHSTSNVVLHHGTLARAHLCWVLSAFFLWNSKTLKTFPDSGGTTSKSYLTTRSQTRYHWALQSPYNGRQ